MQLAIGAKDSAAWSPKFCKIVEQTAPGVFFFHFRGHVPTAAFEPTMRQITRAALERRVTLIGDGSNWMNYEAPYRPLWTNWFIKHRRNIDAVHLVVRSPFLRMGVQVVNLVTNDIIKTYGDRAQLAEIVYERWPHLGDVVRRLDGRAVELTGRP
jgi:hypothetical protein